MLLPFSVESPEFVGTAEVRGVSSASPGHRIGLLRANSTLHDVKEILKSQTPGGLSFLRTGRLMDKGVRGRRGSKVSLSSSGGFLLNSALAPGPNQSLCTCAPCLAQSVRPELKAAS